MGKNNKKLTNDTYLERVNLLYNNKYQYIDLNYENNKSIITIYCEEHNHKFNKRADGHLSGEKCKYCTKEENKLKVKTKYTRTKKFTTEEWISKLNLVHNNFYDYSLNDNIHSASILKIICPIHGKFEQDMVEHFYQEKGCYHCGRIRQKQTLTHNNKEWLEKANKIHNNFYTYDNFIYKNSKVKSYVTCQKHGDFLVKMNDHLYSKSGCPVCNTSIGEKEVENWLIENKISFIKQFSFDDCRYKNSLKFDFYLESMNTCIEYDGVQHFEAREYFGGEEAYKDRILKDSLKTEFCNINNIRLVRIRYNEKVNKKLNKIFYI